MNDTTESGYLRDLGPLLVELALSAKHEAARTGSAYERGRQMGLCEAVSLMVQQAVAFGLSRDEVGLAGVDPDSDLV